MGPRERRRKGVRGQVPRLSMTKLGNDFPQALRVAAHQKSVTVLSVLAFALGIGVTTAVFSIFNGVLLEPLPFPDPEQLVIVYDTQPAWPPARLRSRSITTGKAAIRCSRRWADPRRPSFVLTGDGDPSAWPARRQRRRSPRSSACSRRSAAGTPNRRISRAGPRSSCSPTAFWTRQFDGDPSVIGRTLTFDGEPYEVIGVMPEGSPIATPTCSCRCSASSTRRRAVIISSRPTRGSSRA